MAYVYITWWMRLPTMANLHSTQNAHQPAPYTRNSHRARRVDDHLLRTQPATRRPWQWQGFPAAPLPCNAGASECNGHQRAHQACDRVECNTSTQGHAIIQRRNSRATTDGVLSLAVKWRACGRGSPLGLVAIHLDAPHAAGQQPVNH